MSEGKRQCFVITPLGDENSAVRHRADKVFKHLIAPPLLKCGYEPVRSDLIERPGQISIQIIRYIVDSPMAIADLTGQNPNVMYELAIRHASQKPVVQLIQTGEKIPFDVADTRTIQVNFPDPDAIEYAREQIEKQIQAAEHDPQGVRNPVTAAVDFKALSESNEASRRMQAEQIAVLEQIHRLAQEIRLHQLGLK